ncbi:PDZ domain-containing protein [Streptomyces sp. NPDC020490]|uniref:PDZ domain-containing protein n=1 Tax=Streptomyces sp. NPDC020490 TaxID=3365078 RepID=UPI003790882D
MTESGESPASQARDSVDEIIGQWHSERPDLPVEPVGVITRMARIRSHLDMGLTEVFEGFDLTPADFLVVVTLRRCGEPYRLGQARLMEALGLTSGTISVRLTRLEKLGVIVRESDPADKRTFTVRLTEQGLDLFDRIAPVHLHNEELLLSALAPSEQAQLAHLLRRLLTSFEQTGPRAARLWGMRLEPAHAARRRRAAVGLSDRTGLLVSDVQPDSPASRAGIRAGDLVVRAGGSEVRHSDDLIRPADPVIELELLRGEQPLTATVGTEAAAHPATPAGTFAD